MSKYDELRALIDHQDTAVLMAFIAANPELNYTRISPNGASALWWALMPPRGVAVSVELVQGLLNYIKNDGNFLCNPTQAFASFARPIDYIKAVDYLHKLSALRDALRAAETRYVAPVVAQRGLAAFALDRQSSHSPLITPIVHANIARLYGHYVQDKSRALDAELCARSQMEIRAFIDGGLSFSEEKREQIKQGLDFCYNSTRVFAVRDASIKEHPEWALSLAQLLTLNWLAANERDGRLLPYSVGESGAKNPESGSVSRRKAVLDSLFDIATAYGEGGVSCAAGAFARFGLSLAEQHALVRGSNSGQRLTGLEARRAITQALSAALKRLPEARYMAVIRYVVIAAPNLDDEKEYTSFIQWVQPSLRAELTAMNVDPHEIESSLAVLEDGVYPLAGDTRSFMLQELLHFFEKSSLCLALFYQTIPVASLINEAITVISAALTKNVSFTAWLEHSNVRVADKERGALITYFIKEWLRDVRLQDAPFPLSACINPLSAMYTDCDALKASFKAFVQPLLFVAQFAVKKPELIERNPIQERWLDSLAHQDIIALMGAVYAKENKIFMDFTDETMKAMVLEALQQGVTAHLSLETLCFKNQDLRALDFANSNLNGVSFERCQLPVAGLNLTCTDVRLRECSIPNYPNQNGSPGDLFLLFEKYCWYLGPGLALQFFIQNADAHFFSQKTSQSMSALMLAVGFGRTACLQALLAHRHCSADVFKAKNYCGETVLMRAAKSGQVDCLKALLASTQCSADVFNAQNKVGDSALMLAVQFGHTESLKVLIAHQYCSVASVSTQNSGGNNALMRAAQSGHAECLSVLLAHEHCSIDIFNATNTVGDNALMRAAESGYTECLAVLLASKYCSADSFNAKNNEGETALILAAESGYTECLRVLLASKHCSKAAFTIKSRFGLNALMYVATHGCITCLRMLLASKHCSKEVFNTKDSFGYSALIYVAAHGHIECLRALLGSEHCSINYFNSKNSFGCSALICAAESGHIECINALLAHEYCSADAFNAKNNLNDSALMLATDKGYIKCLKALLSSKHCTADSLNATNYRGETALMRAAASGQIECLHVLLAHEYCLTNVFNAINNSKDSALTLAAGHGRTECLNALLTSKHFTRDAFNAKNYCGNNALIRAAQFGHTDCVKVLIDHEYCSTETFNAKNKHGDSALIRTAQFGHAACLRTLLAHKHCFANSVNARNNDGESALILAAESGHIECLRALLTSNHCSRSVFNIKSNVGAKTLTHTISNEYETQSDAPLVSRNSTESQNKTSGGSINMRLLGGFASALGLAAIALVFTVLNPVMFDSKEVAFACVGVALAGVGFFSSRRGLHGKTELYVDIPENGSNKALLTD